MSRRSSLLATAAARVTFLIFAVLISAPAARAATEDDQWDSQFGAPPPATGDFVIDGANGAINAIATDGTNIYVGGEFTRIGDVNANHIARWDGIRWHVLGTESENGVNGTVHALRFYGRERGLYVGGLFSIAGATNASNIASWNGQWNPLGEGVNGRVRAIALHGFERSGTNGLVYVGGDFQMAGTTIANYIACFNLSSNRWEALDEGMDGPVEALELDGQFLYAGGRFSQAGGFNVRHVARWNPHTPFGVSFFRRGWAFLEGLTGAIGVNGNVYALARTRDSLYVGGTFTEAGGKPASGLARYLISIQCPRSDLCIESNEWQELPGGVSGGVPSTVRTLLTENQAVYVGGVFAAVGGRLAGNLARFDGVNWTHVLGAGVNGNVNAIAGGSSRLLVGGLFSEAGGIPASNLAHWSDNQITALGSGLSYPSPVLRDTLFHDGTNLYVAGQLGTAGGAPNTTNFARWDGAEWRSMNERHELVDSYDTYSLRHRSKLYVYNDRRLFEVSEPENVWTEIGYFEGPAKLGQVVSDGVSLVAVGGFYSVNGVAANGIARWDGANWQPLVQSNPFVQIDSALFDQGDLYVAGVLFDVDGSDEYWIYRWDGRFWHTGFFVTSVHSAYDSSNPVVSILKYSGAIHYASQPQSSSGLSIAGVWDDSRTVLGFAYHSVVLEPAGSYLYFAEDDTGGGGSEYYFPYRNRLNRWDGARWSHLAEANSGIHSVAADSSGGLYLAGNFTEVNGMPVNRIAHWNPFGRPNWSAFSISQASSAALSLRDGAASPASGLGLDNIVHTLAASGPYIYAGGIFTNAGGVYSQSIARWDGGHWASLGNITGNQSAPPPPPPPPPFPMPMAQSPPPPAPANGLVLALTVNGADLYAGGSFTNAGGTTVKNIARWDGAAWSRVGEYKTNTGFLPLFGRYTNIYLEGPEGLVRAVTIFSNEVYAAGQFTSPGQGIARWNGSTWTNLTDGPSYTTTTNSTGTINVIVLFPPDGLSVRTQVTPEYTTESPGEGFATLVMGDRLYIGGNFSHAGTNAVNNVVQWDGEHFHALAEGISGLVYALATDGSLLYVGGEFTAAGGVPATNVACWNGVRWFAVGDGFDGPVYALSLRENHLYAGGTFTTAGGVSASRVARWNGSRWTALGSGVSHDTAPAVHALLAKDDNIFAGGNFTFAGGRPSFYFGRWSTIPADAAEWRTIYFSAAELADPAISGDAADPDGDRMSNGQEYFAGTNPTSAESVFDVEPSSPSDGSVVVTFTAEANRSYTVQFSDAVEAPPNWQRLANIEPRPFRRTETVIDGIPAPTERYYRIITPAL